MHAPGPWGRAATVLAGAAMAGCANLLPHGSSADTSDFASYDAARGALEQVVPYRTTTAELKQLGFDADRARNVREIPYPQLIGRLAPNPSVPFDLLDAGIRDCIVAQQECRAYEFRFGQQSHRREGSFLADFLNFSRTTVRTGWLFEGLVVVRKDVVLFRSHAGEPRIHRIERQRNPLGPLQVSGESSALSSSVVDAARRRVD